MKFKKVLVIINQLFVIMVEFLKKIKNNAEDPQTQMKQ